MAYIEASPALFVTMKPWQQDMSIFDVIIRVAYAVLLGVLCVGVLFTGSLLPIRICLSILFAFAFCVRAHIALANVIAYWRKS